jgi:prophage regulatory protein
MSIKILNKKQVREKTSLAPVTIWRLESAGKFPSRIHLTSNRVGWREDQVETWLVERAQCIVGTKVGRK